MSLTVVGSIAFDAVETPFGKRDRMLGGAATHFALAASFFDQVHVVGPVGDDFGETEMAILSTRVIARVDCLILNDEEIELLTGAPNLIAAAAEVLRMGPSVVVAKQGKYGAALFTADDHFWVPAFPLQTVVDPTGAGDTFAGGFV